MAWGHWKLGPLGYWSSTSPCAHSLLLPRLFPRCDNSHEHSFMDTTLFLWKSPLTCHHNHVCSGCLRLKELSSPSGMSFRFGDFLAGIGRSLFFFLRVTFNFTQNPRTVEGSDEFFPFLLRYKAFSFSRFNLAGNFSARLREWNWILEFLFPNYGFAE